MWCMSSAVVIKSDFNDYYDAEFVRNFSPKEKSYIYERMLLNSRHRAEDLNFLQLHGIPTLNLSPVSNFLLLEPSTLVLVYTMPNEHSGKGKIVLENREAQDLYPNMPGRIWIPHSETDGITLKCLQIGKRRFKITLKGKDDKTDLKYQDIVNIEEIPSEYSKWCKNPIYSIDYIPTQNGLMATDFNQVENLEKLGMHSVMSQKEVYNEIVNSFNYFY